MAVAQAILNGLGYAGTHLKLLRARNPTDLDAGLQALSHTRQTVPSAAARFAVAQEKRSTLELALGHLMELAPAAPATIAMRGWDAINTPSAGNACAGARDEGVHQRHIVPRLRHLRQDGLRQPGKVEILEGLALGDTVVVAGQQRLQKDGTLVRIVDMSKAQAGGANAGAAEPAATTAAHASRHNDAG